MRVIQDDSLFIWMLEIGEDSVSARFENGLKRKGQELQANQLGLKLLPFAAIRLLNHKSESCTRRGDGGRG